MLKTSFSAVLAAVHETWKSAKATEIRKALKTTDYEFKS